LGRLLRRIKSILINKLLEGIDRIKVGDRTITIYADYYDLPDLTVDPALATGRVWMLGGLLKWSPDGVAINFVGKDSVGGLDLAAHASRHLSGGADEVLNLTNVNTAIGFNVADHSGRHVAGGVDAIFNQNLNTTDTVAFAQVTVGDLAFTDIECPLCGKKFEEGDKLALLVREIGIRDGRPEVRAIPAHEGCVNEPRA